jgi:hypothetical protein
MSAPTLTGLSSITDLASATTALDARHAELIAQEADLLAQADDAVNSALAASTSDGKRRFLASARELVTDAQSVRSDIGLIEACWTVIA